VYHGWFFLLLVGAIFGLGYWQGARIEMRKHLLLDRQVSQLRQKSNYEFINPLLECESFSEGNFIRSKELEVSMQKLIERIGRDPDVGHLSIYFRDLNNGPWMGFNEGEKFTPASLLKVPIMIAYFKKDQGDPGYLEKELIYKRISQKDDFIPNVESGVKLEDGKKYSIKKLVEFMIVFSDNEAARMLVENIDPIFLAKVYSDLMIPVPGESGGSENFMTVKEYASFFRILYNASYLNEEMSEKALGLLSQSNFKDGLVAGVSKGTVVAHKFGERSLGNLVQLHDCGIVYKEEKPYLLCVMTRGKKFEKLEWVIKSVSEIVWEETKKQ
jgi:beta-lactamase class A